MAKAGNIKLENIWFAGMTVVGSDANIGSTLSQEQKNELLGQLYFLRAWRYYNPVSYTHLDVYKRQRLIRDKERILNRIPVSMKVIPGIIRSMYHMMYMAWRN